MLEERLLAHLLYKYTPYRTFIINIKVKCFYCKATTVQNFNEKFNLYGWKIAYISVFSSSH